VVRNKVNMLKTSLLLFLTFFSTLASGTKENQHDLISNPTGDTNLPAFLPLGRTFPLRYKAWCLGFSATVEPSVNVELAYQSKQYRPMSQVGAHYSYTHDLSEGLADLPGQDVAHEWGGAFMATTSRFKAGVTLGFGAFHISAELGGRIDMHSYTFSDNSDTNGLTTKAVYEFAKSKLRNDKSLMKQLSSQATGLINLLRAQSKGTSATLASKEDIEDGLREAIAELGPMLINTVQMAKRKINQEIRVPLMNAMQKGLKSPGVKAMKPRLSAGNTPKSLARRFGSAVSKTDEDNILKTYEKRLRYLVTRLVYDITYQIATKVFFGRDDLDMFAVYVHQFCLCSRVVPFPLSLSLSFLHIPSHSPPLPTHTHTHTHVGTERIHPERHERGIRLRLNSTNLWSVKRSLASLNDVSKHRIGFNLQRVQKNALEDFFVCYFKMTRRANLGMFCCRPRRKNWERKIFVEPILRWRAPRLVRTRIDLVCGQQRLRVSARHAVINTMSCEYEDPRIRKLKYLRVLSVQSRLIRTWCSSSKFENHFLLSLFLYTYTTTTTTTCRYTSKRNGRIASLKDNAAIYRLYYPNVYRDNVPHCPDPSNSMTLLQHNIWSDCVVKVRFEPLTKHAHTTTTTTHTHHSHRYL